MYLILIYIKSLIIYNPIKFSPKKYNSFYKKIFQLTESEKNIINIFVNSDNDIYLDTLYLKNPDTNKCIIFFHGGAGNISMRFDIIKFLYTYASVIVFDYRGYGKSSGIVSLQGLNNDAKSIWKFAIENLKIPANNISLFGESLGCAIAIELAVNLSQTLNKENYPQSLILNSPFYSLSSMVEHIFSKIKIAPVGKIIGNLIANEYRSNKSILLINHNTKIIIAHSPMDEIIPYTQALDLYNLVKKYNKNIIFFPIGGTHNNLGLTDNYIYELGNLFN